MIIKWLYLLVGQMLNNSVINKEVGKEEIGSRRVIYEFVVKAKSCLYAKDLNGKVNTLIFFLAHQICY